VAAIVVSHPAALLIPSISLRISAKRRVDETGAPVWTRRDEYFRVALLFFSALDWI
jgi:hypothetical protein